MPFNGKYITQIRKDTELIQALNAMLPLINTQKTTLGLTAQQVTDLTTLCNTFIAQYTTATTARQNAKAQDEIKDANRKAAMNSLLSYVKQWRANTAIPDSLLEQLFVAPHKTAGTKTPPVTPVSVQLSANAAGFVTIKWERNGNKQGTQFIIQTRDSATGEWTLYGTTTKAKFELNWEAGTYLGVRIIAQRDSLQSQPTNEAVLWNQGGGATLQLAA